ncbi:hypothetical protein [Chryseobacterium sp. Leaf201]|uniref:hypothetical protein n=1 Tax=Chryseobacterium sp. Leaf201 TaxID=1735672 RepID=UPI0006F7B004|nr:hypothetical protein [Chryseobacterium sp. Leaf201]KQM43893.1 hypothetical protein ASE55_12180 [Chryseobacterium sp. Leaf201]
MDGTYFFSAFGTFGNPNGFRQSFFLGGSAAIAKELRTFDLKTDAIMLFPDNKIYGIRKDHSGGNNLISYSVYTFAKEQKSHRGGTFIGSSLVFAGKIAPENLIISVLDDFHNTLEKNNVSEGVITISHSDQFAIHKPKDFDKIGFHLQEVNDVSFTQSNGNYLVVYCETDPAKLQVMFSKSRELLNNYDTIFFTQSHEIGEFVKQKGIFKIVEPNGFEHEISRLHEERLRLVQVCLDEFKKEHRQLEEERKRLIDSLHKQIEQNEKYHKENEKKIEQSKERIGIINNEYSQYTKKTDELIKRLETDGKVEAAKKTHQENRRLFTDTISRNKTVEPLASLSAFNPGARAPMAYPGYGHQPEEYGRRKRDQEKEPQLDSFKVVSAILLLLLIVSYTLYFIFIYEPKHFGSLGL